jgi:hypothetical protein
MIDLHANTRRRCSTVKLVYALVGGLRDTSHQGAAVREAIVRYLVPHSHFVILGPPVQNWSCARLIIPIYED